MIGHLAAAAQAGIPVILFYRFDVEEALRLIERWRATFTVGAITVFIAMANHPDVARRNLTSLRKVWSGGAPVSPAIVHRFREMTGAYIHNIYGMTETTSPSHAVPLGVEAPVDPTTGALAIGVPVPGAEARIVDLESGNIVWFNRLSRGMWLDIEVRRSEENAPLPLREGMGEELRSRRAGP